MITLHREAILLRPNPHHQQLVSLGGLAETLYAIFHHTNDMSNLDEAITLLREAVKACPESYPCHIDLLNSLSTVLVTRFDKTGQLLDLHKVMTQHHDMLQAIDTGNEGKAYQLLDFATNLAKQFAQTSEMADLELNDTLILLAHALSRNSSPKTINLMSTLLLLQSTLLSSNFHPFQKSKHKVTANIIAIEPHIDEPLLVDINKNTTDSLELIEEPSNEATIVKEALL
jgi:hypothetical protein